MRDLEKRLLRLENSPVSEQEIGDVLESFLETGVAQGSPRALEAAAEPLELLRIIALRMDCPPGVSLRKHLRLE